jgi:hypothetical protein
VVDRLSEAWLAFCGRGKISIGHQRRSVESCVGTDGVPRGHYSDVVLDPTLPDKHSMYPSHDHTTSPRDHRSMVVDARVFNDMKSHLDELEFWLVIEHFYAVGRANGRIPSRSPERLPTGWAPNRNF